MTDHDHGQLCVAARALLDGGAVGYVYYSEPINPADSGFAVFDLDWPLDRDPTDEEADELLVALCLHCLIDRHPEAGPGLDEAQRAGYWCARP